MKNKYIVNEDVLLSAFRYALGRQTYIVNSIVKNILNNWNDISDKLKNLMKREIQEAIDTNEAGMDCDVKEWRKILDKNF